MTAPIQAEIHRHLDCSVRASTLLELAQKNGLFSQSTSLESFKDQFLLRKPLKNLAEVIARFGLFQQVLDTPDILERVAFECAEDCWNEGTRLVEFRYSPGFLSEKTVGDRSDFWSESLCAIERGLAKAALNYPGLKTGLICIASRDYGTDSAAETVEFYLRNLTRFVGIDLAGNENQFPCRLFESAFKPVLKHFDALGIPAPITIHSGEDAGAENIWEAIEHLGARRIGHGVRCLEDPELVRVLAERALCLEVCPTSNWLTGVIARLKDHPLPRMIDSGLVVTINTDDPGIFECTLPGELKVCREVLGISETVLLELQDNAVGSSFIPQADS